jgi:preprotein translocase subunit SecE
MQRFQKYLTEVVKELKKVTWPTWDELKGSTMVVILFSIVMGVYIAGIDFILTYLVDLFL